MAEGPLEREPHEYVLRRNVDPLAFELMVLHLREHGRQEVYAGYEYTRLDVGNDFVWTMGDSLPTMLPTQPQAVGSGQKRRERTASPGLFARRERSG